MEKTDKILHFMEVLVDALAVCMCVVSIIRAVRSLRARSAKAG